MVYGAGKKAGDAGSLLDLAPARSSMVASSDRVGIDPVVLAVRADEPDEYHAPVVMHGGDETVVVAARACRSRKKGLRPE